MIRNDNDFMAMSMKSYENIQCVSLEEFKEDLYRITTIRKCITKYLDGDELNVRLMLNQFVILFNVFGEFAFDMLKYESQYPIAFAFLVQINRLPESEMILLNQTVVQQLREL
jgi:hypothetical protein